MGIQQFLFQGGATLVVALDGSIPANVWTSPDGVAWTNQGTKFGSLNSSAIGFGRGGFKVKPQLSIAIYTSLDALTWTATSEGTSTSALWENLEDNGTEWLVDTEGGFMRRSLDGLGTYASVSTVLVATPGLVWTGTQWILVGGSSGAPGRNPPYMTFSPTGATWTPAPTDQFYSGSSPVQGLFNIMLLDSGRLITYGANWLDGVNPNRLGIFYSDDDGATWTEAGPAVASPVAVFPRTNVCCTDGGDIVIISAEGGFSVPYRIYVSRDAGLTYSFESFGVSLPSGDIAAMAWVVDKFVMIARDGSVYTSADAAFLSWVDAANGPVNMRNNAMVVGSVPA